MSSIAQAAKAYAEQGYSVVRNWLDATTIELLTHEADRILSAWMSENRGRYIEKRLVNMHSLTGARYFSDAMQSVQFFELLASERLTAVIDGIFGAHIYFHNPQLFFKVGLSAAVIRTAAPPPTFPRTAKMLST